MSARSGPWPARRRRPRSRRRRRARPGSARSRSGCARTASRSARAPDSTPASWPAPVGRIGAPPSSSAIRSASEVSKATSALTDSRVTATSVPSRPARSAARFVTASTSESRVGGVRRPGVQPAAHQRRDGVGGVRLGPRPGPSWRARRPAGPALFAASTVYAKVSIGSRRSAIRVVPAWSPRPVKSNRQRPCGQIALATPTGTSSARPCSMCSSTRRADSGAEAGQRRRPGPRRAPRRR